VNTLLDFGITLVELWPVIPTIIVYELFRPVLRGFWNRWKAAVEEE